MRDTDATPCVSKVHKEKSAELSCIKDTAENWDGGDPIQRI